MKFATVQFTPTVDPEENLRKIRDWVAAAADEGAHVVVLPEQSMTLLQAVTVERLGEIAAEWWGPFEREIAQLAKEHSVVIIAAGFEPTGGLPFNTMIAVGHTGVQLACYRKLHLFEGFAMSESAHTLAGEELPPVFDVQAGGESLRIGLANCYDLRFPELFRSLSERGAHAVAVSAAWASGPGKEAHWTLLTQTRALENVNWLIASATVGGGQRGNATVGLSRIVEPLGTVVAQLGPTGEGVVVADVTEEAVGRARATLPALANRRIHTDYRVE